MTDIDGESMDTSEGITDRIDARFADELQVKQDEVNRAVEARDDAMRYEKVYFDQNNALKTFISKQRDRIDALMAERGDLQAKLDASIPMPVDAYGEPWTGEDVDKPFLFAEDAECKTLREIAITWWGRSWCLVDDYDTHYPADRCHHVAPEQPESIDDVRRTVGRGYTYRDQDVLCAIDRAYACGRRDGAGERA